MGRLWLELHITDGQQVPQDFFGHVEFSNALLRITPMREIPGRIIHRVKVRDCISKFLSLSDHIQMLADDALAESLVNPCADAKEAVVLLADLKGSVHDLLDLYSKILSYQRDQS